MHVRKLKDGNSNSEFIRSERNQRRDFYFEHTLAKGRYQIAVEVNWGSASSD